MRPLKRLPETCAPLHRHRRPVSLLTMDRFGPYRRAPQRFGKRLFPLFILTGASGACGDAAACDDADGDGYYAVLCGGNDCDDSDARINPGAQEVCDPDFIDEDCDPSTLGNEDRDRDGFLAMTCGNYQPNGVLLTGDDCDDTNPDIHPNQVEVCNGVDDNCDGRVDEGLRVDAWIDNDEDGYGAAGSSAVAECPGTPRYAYNALDCDDTNPHIFPGAIRCRDHSPNAPGAFAICTAGNWESGSCEEQATCVTQPAGHGICTL